MFIMSVRVQIPFRAPIQYPEGERIMSRSYKHTPRSGDTKSRDMKRAANRKFRRNKNYDETLHHKQYRKYFCSYDICDYETIGETFEEYYQRIVNNWYRWEQYYNIPFPDKKQIKKEYDKWFIRK